jgi:hypothetical protein
MRIIVCEEKHSTRHWDASTDEAWAKSSLAILTERFNEGYWYYNPEDEQHEFSLNRRKERDELLAMTDEQIDAIPSDEVRVGIRRKIKAAKADRREDEQMAAEYEEIRQVVESQDLSMVTVGGGKWAHQEPKAWTLLDARSDHEYEGVSLETLEGVEAS